jgi:hypothetical protein
VNHRGGAGVKAHVYPSRSLTLLVFGAPRVPTPPAVGSFSPTKGNVGINVTVNGSGFTGPTSVAFGGTATTPVSVASSTKLTVRVPAGAATGTISVTTPGGTGMSGKAFTVTG